MIPLLTNAPVATRWIERMRRAEPLPAPIAAALVPVTGAMQWGMRRRLRQPAARLTAYVISFGNLTTGGTGKTPAVIERAQREMGEGRRVAVLTRGYGAPSKGTAISAEFPSEQWYSALGDEASLIAQKVPGAIVIKNQDRVAAGRDAIARFGCNLLILDDGYQYTALDRDENVLVIDAANPFGNGRLLPRGMLREPIAAAKRATQIVLTRCDQAADIHALIGRVREVCPNTPIRTTWHRPTGFRHVATGRTEDLTWIAGREICATCAIGNPDAFVRTLESLGAVVLRRTDLRDHAALSGDVLSQDTPVVITEKDSVRIANPPDNAYVLTIELADFATPKD